MNVRWIINGKELRGQELARWFRKRRKRLSSGAAMVTPSKGWPMCSEAAGVAASQVDEVRTHSQRIGIATDFTPDGRAIFRSRAHRKAYCEAIGLYDRNGGYGDPQRRT